MREPIWTYHIGKNNDSIYFYKTRKPHPQEMDARVCFLAPPHDPSHIIRSAIHDYRVQTIGL